MYAENFEILEAELDGSSRKGNPNKVTQDKKNQCWDVIVNAVNSLGYSKRSRAQMKKKLSEIKSSGNIHRVL